jgi:hypothetical protein
MSATCARKTRPNASGAVSLGSARPGQFVTKVFQGRTLPYRTNPSPWKSASAHTAIRSAGITRAAGCSVGPAISTQGSARCLPCDTGGEHTLRSPCAIGPGSGLTHRQQSIAGRVFARDSPRPSLSQGSTSRCAFWEDSTPIRTSTPISRQPCLSVRRIRTPQTGARSSFSYTGANPRPVPSRRCLSCAMDGPRA